ncbi:MAG: DUF937 domain-containing protein [Vicinamibacteria bacterium]|nr:DUF937 domain-containing protein [Vicinamibacteria bacterium]
MNMIEALLGNQAGGVVQQLGQQFGLDKSQTSSALTALLPALAAGFKQNTSSQNGLDSLIGALSQGQHGRYLDEIQNLGRPETIDDGNGILGHIFGGKQVSREVARKASAQSGVGTDILKKMLPVVAAIVMGAMAKKQLGGSSQPGLGAQLGGQGGAGGLLGMLTPMLDADGDGSVVNDVVGMIGKFMGRR